MKELICLVLALCLFAGCCACGQGEAAAPTTTEATTAAAVRKQFEHVLTQRIHESLPEFTFELRGCVWQPESWPEMEFADIQSVEISDPNSEFYQLFDEFDIVDDMPFYMHQVMFLFEDYNKDGYLDLRLQLVHDRNTRYSLFWLWDNAQQCFVENEQLRELSYGCNLFIGDDGNLRGSNTAGGGIGWGHTTYQYKNSEFIETEAKSWLVEPDGVYVSTYKLIDGEMVLISKELEDYQ